VVVEYYLVDYVVVGMGITGAIHAAAGRHEVAAG
jgi:hypothetical protein